MARRFTARKQAGPRKSTASRAAAPARTLALAMLKEVRNPRGRGMDAVLEHARRSGQIGAQDVALAREIAYGVCRRRRWLEEILARYVHRPLPSGAVRVHEALLCGIFQAIYLHRIPPHSIVDETVRLTGQVRTEAGYRRLANAVMRRIVETPRAELLPGPDVSWPVRESMPDWLASEAGQVLPTNELHQFFAALNEQAPLSLRITRPAAESPEVPIEERLRGEVVDLTHALPEIAPGRFLPECLHVRARGLSPEYLPLFQRGFVTAEDEGAQFAGWLAGPRPGMSVLDLCASPGGKTAHLLDLMDRRPARFVATDVGEEKLDRLRETLDRLALRPLVETREVSTLPEHYEPATFDLVLVDAPCTGLGTLRRHPEIRWRRSPRQVRELAQTQAELLRQAATWVRPGGTILYSVCTFTVLETDRVIDEFLHENTPAFTPAEAPEALPFDTAPFSAGPGKWRTFTHRHACDTFYVAKLQRAQT